MGGAWRKGAYRKDAAFVMAFLKLKPTLAGHVRKAIFAFGGQEGEDAFKKRTKHFPPVIERYSPTEARSLLGVFLSWASPSFPTFLSPSSSSLSLF